MLDDIETVRLDAYDPIEMGDLMRACRPDVTEAEIDEMLAGYIEMRWRKSLH